MRYRGGSSACADGVVTARSRQHEPCAGSSEERSSAFVPCWRRWSAGRASRARPRRRRRRRRRRARAARHHLRGLEGRLPRRREAAGRPFKAIGFQIVSFVPTYAYVGLDKIDLAAGPDAAELGAAVEAALRAGFSVVIKPHLDPPAYQPGFDPVQVGQPQLARDVPVARLLRSRSDGGRLPRGRRVRDAAHAQGRPRSRGRGGGDAGAPGGRRRADELRRLHARALGAAAGRRQEGAAPPGPRRQGARCRTTSPTTSRSPRTTSGA